MRIRAFTSASCGRVLSQQWYREQESGSVMLSPGMQESDGWMDGWIGDDKRGMFAAQRGTAEGGVTKRILWMGEGLRERIT